ncbi:MAG: acylphosphatase [Planctomycetales bacterium]|nr:acylphosphatase [Planctomycetales bacterium]NIP70056.1 acylphosphatase [Planctomycetales bacterium]
MAASIVQREALFEGQVQGVGFRYATRHIAADFTITGYVKNLADGRVQVVAEGTEVEVNRFLAAVEKRLERYIRQVRTETRTPTHNFSYFEIAF